MRGIGRRGLRASVSQTAAGVITAHECAQTNTQRQSAGKVAPGAIHRGLLRRRVRWYRCIAR